LFPQEAAYFVVIAEESQYDAIFGSHENHAQSESDTSFKDSVRKLLEPQSWTDGEVAPRGFPLGERPGALD